ncbi:MAG: MBL fold metallo-hydrolase [Thiotrichaceae bacterium]|nr:MBL fold metallo-hydrolase [Thiotrichaceae bacterium]
MKIITIPVTPYQQNCSLVICSTTKTAAIIDPGGDCELILQAIEKSGAQVKKIILTHGHLDHVGGAKILENKLNVPILGPEKADDFLLQLLPEQSQQFQFPHQDAFVPKQWLKQGDQIVVGALTLNVLHIPGHTPGHIALHEPKKKKVIVGDILFNNSIGRTDLPGGDHGLLIKGIKQKLFTLPQETTVYPGHGPLTTIENERMNNPYIRH